MQGISGRTVGRLHSLSLLLLIVVVALSAGAEMPAADGPKVEARVDALLAKMSLEEKIDLLGGVDKFYMKAMPSIGLPRLRMSDGPMGVREWGFAPAYPGGIALAATWDPQFAEVLGARMGQDARARGVAFLLAPGVNLYRAPMSGRTFEYFGEDPVLAGDLAVGFIEGVQKQGVIATIKHFAANNQEFNRVEVSSDIDERTLHELYLPVFEAAVKRAHVGAVMDGYNPVNGLHPTQNAELNCKILKHDWQYSGIVMSDWGATHNAVAAANACLDVEMPSGDYFNRENLLPAVREGKVSLATIDDKVRRILRDAVEFGLLDRPLTDLQQDLYSENNRQVALQGAPEGAVLLRNEGGILPLDAGKVKKLAVIGPNATPANYSGGGSSKVTPYDAVSTLTGLMDYLDGKANVEYDRGLPDLDEFSKATAFTFHGKPGVQLELFDNKSLAGKPFKTLIVPNIEPDSMGKILNAEGTLPGNIKAMRFRATYTPRVAGNTLFLTSGGGSQSYASGEDAYTLRVDGQSIASIAPFEQQAPLATYRDIATRKPLSITFDYILASPRAYPRLAVSATADLISERAKRMAASADAVVVAVGFNPDTEREGMDRSFELPYGQAELIRELAKINPRTIVVLNNGGAVDMRDWVDKPAAILEQWYPGQEGGKTLAQMLFGEHDPEGKLPITFDRSWEDSPVHNVYYAQERNAATQGTVESFTYNMAGTIRTGKVDRGVTYADGLLNGYRYYAGAHVKPQFPFGFGLSYTTFAFSHLYVGSYTDGKIEIAADVTNTGKRRGAEVLQLYVGLPSDHVSMPDRELKGFRKVDLAPGETAHIAMPLTSRDLSYYDVTSHGWKLDSGDVQVFIGDSAENTPLFGSFHLSE